VEERIDFRSRGRPARFNHLSKVHDSANVALACKIWGLMSTDIMQGVVYGTRSRETDNKKLLTRFDFDEIFGTVINRFAHRQSRIIR